MREETQIEKYLPELKCVKIFHWLHEIELKKLLIISQLFHFDKGETIINQDEVGNHLYAVIKGTVEVSVKNKSGQKVVVCTIGEGEIFGEAAIFLASKRTATIACLSETTTLRISRQDLIYFFKTHPRAGNKLLMLIVLSLLEKLRHANQDLVLEKQPQVDFSSAADLIQEFIQDTGHSSGTAD
jgi:CRP-like cAMP-binding protein